MKPTKHYLIIFLLLTTIAGAATATGESTSEPVFSEAELDQMLAPVALYPDVLLSQVLMAATYPLEVVEASRWSRAHPDISGEDAELAVEDKDWDRSIKYLVGFPDLIQLMDENLAWTRRLGDAFLLQEEQVMERTQVLRRRSLEEGSLDSMAHIAVEEEDDVIILEPAEVEVVYVPYYSSHIVYGDWWWHDYPPVYWNPPPVYYGNVGLCWSRGFRVSTGFYFSAFDWHIGNIVIRNYFGSRSRYDHDWYHHRSRYDRKVWRHDTRHRRGVNYHVPGLNVRYGRSTASGRPHPPIPAGNHVRRQDKPLKPDPIHRPDRSVRPDRRERNDSMARMGRPERSKKEQNDRSVKQRSPGKRQEPKKSPGRVASKKPDRNKESTRGNKSPRQKPPSGKPPPSRGKAVVSHPDEKGKSESYQSSRPTRGSGNVALSRDRGSNRNTSRQAPKRPRDP